MFPLSRYFSISNFTICAFRNAYTKYPVRYKKPLIFKEDVFKKPRKRQTFPLYVDDEKKLAPKVEKLPKQKFDFFIVIDFEATCDSPINVEPPEIIEFPALKVNGKTLNTESIFHSYVKPTIYPELSSFCSELTGIIQGMVDNQPEFKVVFQNFLKWMEDEELLKPGVKFAFVSCGDPDLDYILPIQCGALGIEVPDFMKRWINIKRSFCDIKPYTWPDNLSKMLQICELKPQGELHSGLDDSKNIARVLKNLAERGVVFDFNGWKKSKME